MVVPSTQSLLTRLTHLSGQNLPQRELQFRAALDAMIPSIFWGATPTKVELMPFLEPVLPRRLWKFEFANEPKPGVPKQLLIDVDFGGCPHDGSIFICRPITQSPSFFDQGARLQELARMKIPHLVPRVIRVGRAEGDDPDDAFDYIVTEHMPETVTLDKVWPSLSPESRGKIMDELVNALESLHDLDISSFEASMIGDSFDLSGNADYTSDTATIPPSRSHRHSVQCSCPHPHHNDHQYNYINILLAKFAVEARHRAHPQTCLILPNPDDSFNVICVVNDDGGDADDNDADAIFTFTIPEIKELNKNLVLCHMDLEPRNLLVRLVQSSDGGPGEYQLAAITSWERAVPAPFAYERGIKDSFLGCQFNHDYSWYKLFVERTKHLLPEAEAHDKYIAAAVMIMLASRTIAKLRPNPRHQKRWFAKEEVVGGDRFRDGYVRRPGAEDLVSPTDRDYRDMGDAIVADVVARWTAHILAHHGADVADDALEEASGSDRTEKGSDEESDTTSVDDAYHSGEDEN
ncbi:hypothetical protein CPLU01_04274 [Colletotrichum plurivorum]|uniref:Aminoglycoside phosphotransferase domain-containing protein n=1 Tax=Colletotrichum plurivorum TaxID=2175906 RepID=A0A8H6KR85_9PEZI|nr:hypothetical protein CPLU01_04274 [Colletotrichum plurivorum]